MSEPNSEESRLWPLRYDKRSGNAEVVLIWPREGLDKCHDVTEENGASSNTPHEMGIEDKMRCDVALRDLGPSRGKVEPNDLV